MSRRVWSKKEDEQLPALVQHFGDRRGRDGQWTEISKRLPGRTNKDCRKRWFHSLDPALRRGRWTKEEDGILLAAHERLGPAWKEIALLINGRKDDQCAKRYNDILNPLAKDRLKDWSPKEDQYLTVKVHELGNHWATIAAGLPGRPPLTCRNRWRRLSKDLSNVNSSSSAELTSSPDTLPFSAFASTSEDFASLPSDATGIQVLRDSHRLEGVSTHLSLGVSENLALSPLFSPGDISPPTLETPEGYQLPSMSYVHENFQELDPRGSNTTHLESRTGHKVSFPEQPSSPSALSPQGDSNNIDSVLGLLDSVNRSPDSLSSMFPTQEVPADPYRPMPRIEETQQSSLEEAAILQLFSSTRDPSSIPNEALSTLNLPDFSQQVQHHHHHYHHHYHHYQQ